MVEVFLFVSCDDTHINMLLVHHVVKHVSSPVITALNVAIRRIELYSAGFLSLQTEHKTWA